MGLNKAMLIGNVGKEPEVRKTANSTVCNFSMATNDRRFKDADGNPRTEWHNVVAWGKLAEIIGEHVTKGTSLYIEGRIQTRKWETNAGETRYSTEIVADQMDILSSKAAKPATATATADVPYGNSSIDDPGF
jgi:single-strand DNA-binding protein